MRKMKMKMVDFIGKRFGTISHNTPGLSRLGFLKKLNSTEWLGIMALILLAIVVSSVF